MSVGDGEPGLGLKSRHRSLPKTDRQIDRHPPPTPRAFQRLSTRGRCFQAKASKPLGKADGPLRAQLSGGAGQGGVPRGSVEGPEGGPASSILLSCPRTRARSNPIPLSVQPSEGSGGSWACGSAAAKWGHSPASPRQPHRPLGGAGRPNSTRPLALGAPRLSGAA